MHQRLMNELVLSLARRALGVIAPCLRDEEHNDAFREFFEAFKEELLRYEEKRERMQTRLKGPAKFGGVSSAPCVFSQQVPSQRIIEDRVGNAEGHFPDGGMNGGQVGNQVAVGGAFKHADGADDGNALSQSSRPSCPLIDEKGDR